MKKSIFCLLLIGIGFSYGQSRSPTIFENPNKETNAINQQSQKMSLSNPMIGTNPPANKSNGNQNNLGNWTLADKLTSIGLAITFMVGLAGIFQARISQKTAQRQTRAYVSITPNREMGKMVLQCTSTGKKFKFFLDGNNFGQTPAKNIKFRAKIDIVGDDIGTAVLQLSQIPVTGNKTINPGEPAWFFVEAGEFFSIEKIDNVRNETLRLILFGDFEYEDIFGEKTIIKFCFQKKSSTWEAMEGFNGVTFPEDRNT